MVNSFRAEVLCRNCRSEIGLAKLPNPIFLFQKWASGNIARSPTLRLTSPLVKSSACGRHWGQGDTLQARGCTSRYACDLLSRGAEDFAPWFSLTTVWLRFINKLHHFRTFVCNIPASCFTVGKKKKALKPNSFKAFCGGEGGIRTLETL